MTKCHFNPLIFSKFIQLAGVFILFSLRFMEVSDYVRVTDSLKRHAVAVREPPVCQSLLVTSYP